MRTLHARGIFVTGTDTGVGKTIIAGGLAALFRKWGAKVGVMKPIETGCAQEDGRFIPADGLFLKEMAETDLPLETIVPYQFKEPLAPWVSAQREGMVIDLDLLVEKFKKIYQENDFVLVEGAGGILVPIGPNFFFLNLIKEFKLPVLIVSRAALGAINHTLLTLRVAQSEKITVAGIILNHISPEKTIASETNPQVISSLTTVPIWGAIPFYSNLRPQFFFRDAITQLIQRHLDLTFIQNLFSEQL
ncbi:MAG: dethiobiotin synthase [Desulfobacterota bacterium]|nr:dethiobiotin synthase [Thermodesulfobacteriota bacterium]